MNNRKILILNCSPRSMLLISENIIIPRNTYNVSVPKTSSCGYITHEIIKTITNDYMLYKKSNRDSW
jgi:hypothetical protein